MEILTKLKENSKAWLTVAMINIPLSISLAVASWATPLQWIITWIWAWIIAAFFASSSYNVFWVAWALSSILLAFTFSHGENGVLLLPMIAIFSGIFMLIIYFLKITKYITLIPSTALHWFLISVGITIALWQISGGLWLNNPALHITQHKETIMNLVEVFKNLSSISIASLVTFLSGLFFLIWFKKFFPKFPAVIVLTILWIWVWLLVSKWYFPDMLLLIDKYPSLKFALFDLPFTKLSFASFSDFVDVAKWLISISMVVTVIAIIETVISAKIAEKITKVKFDKDKEVLWLAIANIWTWLLWGLPNTAVFIRTKLNIDSGANHKASWFLISLFTLLISALLFNWAFAYLPFPIISAILMNIALWLIDIALLKKLYNLEKSAFFITLITTFFSVVFEATYWILIWTTITLIIYIKKITNTDANISIWKKGNWPEKVSLSDYVEKQEEWDVILTKFSWWLNFINIENNISLIEKLEKNQHVIISMSHIWNIDVDWLEAIDEMIEVLETKNIDVYISWYVDSETHFITKLHHFHRLQKSGKVFSSSTEALNTLIWK